MGDLQSKFAYLRRLGPAERKIKQRDFENRMGLAPGTLSEEFGTGKKPSPQVAPAKPKAKAKPKPKSTKATTKKKKTTKKKSE